MPLQPFSAHFHLLSLSFPVPQDSHPIARSESPGRMLMGTGDGWKRRNLQAKTNQSNPPSRVLEKHPPPLFSLGLMVEGRGEKGAEYTLTYYGKKPTTVDEHSVNGSLSPSLLFSRLLPLAGTDDGSLEA